MGALLILVLAAVYLLIAYKVTKKIKPWWGKIAAIAIFLLIPTADAVYGRIKFDRMCESEAGLKIYRVVEGVEGFYDPTSSPYEGWIKKYGYRFIEGNALNGKDARMVHLPDGTIRLETGITPISKYAYEEKKSDLSEIYYRVDQRVRVRGTDEILGEQINITYAGGWFNRLIAGLYASRGQAGVCGPGTSIDDLVTKTLKPVK